MSRSQRARQTSALVMAAGFPHHAAQTETASEAVSAARRVVAGVAVGEV
jgi:hypothetical protein